MECQNKKCPVCETVFETNKSTKKFCSKKCKSKFFNNKNKDLIKELTAKWREKNPKYSTNWSRKNKEKVRIYADKYNKTEKSKLRFIKHRNTEKYKNKYREYYNLNKHRILSKSREWYLNNKERKNKNSSEWYLNNQKIVKQIRARFLEKNPNYRRFATAKRRALLKKRMIGDFRKEIINIYNNCPRGYHVDHIIPINGKQICGLHVPWNLQYLKAEDNLKKSNKLLPI